MRKAIDWLLAAIEWSMFSSKRRQDTKPGEIIAKMSPEAREELKKLTSDDVADIRPKEWEMMGWDPVNTFPKEQTQKLLTDFDKKILK